MRKKNIILGIIFIILGILLDQIVKIIVRVTMEEGKNIPIIKGFFHIAHIENTGAAWGGLSNLTVLLIILSIGILGFFIYMFRNINFKEKMVFSISLVMVISGTIGNLIDRLIFQSVTDFLDFYIFGYDYPVFNIADILLVVGFFLFLIDLVFLSDKDDEKTKDVVAIEEKPIEVETEEKIVSEEVEDNTNDINSLDEDGDSNERRDWNCC